MQLSCFLVAYQLPRKWLSVQCCPLCLLSNLGRRSRTPETHKGRSIIMTWDIWFDSNRRASRKEETNCDRYIEVQPRFRKKTDTESIHSKYSCRRRCFQFSFWEKRGMLRRFQFTEKQKQQCWWPNAYGKEKKRTRLGYSSRKNQWRSDDQFDETPEDSLCQTKNHFSESDISLHWYMERKNRG